MAAKGRGRTKVLPQLQIPLLEQTTAIQTSQKTEVASTMLVLAAGLEPATSGFVKVALYPV